MVTTSEPIPTNAADRGAHVSRVAIWVLIAFSAVVGLALPSGPAVAAGHDFTICQGRFALCAASTCKPTGKTITVNVTSGGTAPFPEYDCTCPIVDGPALADLAGGNMQGSCTPPPGQIWSLYQPREHIPQAITNWDRAPSKTSAPPLVCRKDLNLGNKLVNCFSFACNPAGNIKGVPVATCHCPLGESLEGTGVDAATAFATQAGQRNTAICAQYPVGGPLPSPHMPAQ
ncbi:MAG: hypothetical protein AB7H71_07355 [Alphaproteobacteria bacterium]